MASNPILSLHRYFVWADRMRVHFKGLIDSEGKDDSKSSVSNAFAYPYMAYWYAGLYVVIEGWQELKLSDEKIDVLLHSENVELLKRFRNGVSKGLFRQPVYGFHAEAMGCNLMGLRIEKGAKQILFGLVQVKWVKTKLRADLKVGPYEVVDR